MLLIIWNLRSLRRRLQLVCRRPRRVPRWLHRRSRSLRHYKRLQLEQRMSFRTSRTQNSWTKFTASFLRTKMKQPKHHKVLVRTSKILSKVTLKLTRKLLSKKATTRPSNSNKYYMKINLFFILFFKLKHSR